MTDDPASFWRTQGPIVALFVANAVACTVIACFLTAEDYEVVIYMALGISFAQAISLALWSALGESRGVVRVVGSLFLLTLAMGASAIFARRDTGEWIVGIGIAAVTFFHCLIPQLPLCVGAQFVWLACCLSLVRMAGYRWMRRNKYAAPPEMFAVEKPVTP